MQFVANPNIFNGVFLFQLIDNALADIAEGSDIIGKYFKANHHFSLWLQKLPLLLFRDDFMCFSSLGRFLTGIRGDDTDISINF